MERQGAMTITDALIPRRGLLVDGLLVLGASIGIALSAQIAVPLPFSPVPVTGQTFAVLLAGALLGSRRGALALVAYLAEGVSGLPVFAGWKGGAAHLAGPTGGYLIAFTAAAWVTGRLCEAGWDRRVRSAAAAMFLGSLVILAGGAAWLSLFIGAERAVTLGVVPFLAGDIVKIALAAMALPGGWRLVRAIR